MVSTILLPALGIYTATNIDDLILLALLFARGAQQPGSTWRIVLGHYLGMLLILAMSVIIALGAGFYLPLQIIPLFGLVPIGMGLWVIWRHRRGGDHDEQAHLGERKVGVWTALVLTVAHGGNNMGVYIPVFLRGELTTMLTYCVIFLLLAGGALALARFISQRSGVADFFTRWDHIVYPAVLIGVGVWILVEGWLL